MICRKAGCALKTRVKELRTAAGLTQQQLADLVHVSSRTIISLEKEQYSPSLMLAYRLAVVFGVSGGGAVLPGGKPETGGSEV